MNRAELRELLRGLVVVATTPMDDNYELDLGNMYEITQWWVESGVVTGRACIKIASVMGEVPQLRDREFGPLVRTVVQAADGKVPIIAGIHDKDTIRAIEDAKKAQDLGAIGLQVSPPLYNDPTQDDMLRYFEALSDAIEIGVMIYHTHWMPHCRIEVDTFRKMADFEQIMAIKWNSPADVPYEAMTSLTADFNILDNSNQPVRCYQNGGHGFLDHEATAYPAYELRILDLIEAGQYDEAQQMWDRLTGPLDKLYADFALVSGGQARLKKGVMAAMGRPVGSQRPPSLPLTEDEMDQIRAVLRGAGWPVPEPVAVPA